FWQSRDTTPSRGAPDVSPTGMIARFGRMPCWPGVGGMGRIAQAVGIAVATWVICYVPFWEGAQTLQPLTGGPAARLFVNSLASMVRFKAGEWLHRVAVEQGWAALRGKTADFTRILIEGWIRWIAWGLTFLLAVRCTWRGRAVFDMLKGWGLLLFFYLTIGAVWFWPWYVSWLVVPAALVGPGRLMKATLILCLTSLLLYAVYPELPSLVGEILYWRALLIIAPALVYFGVDYALQRKTW
ncbi:MAG: hypothetical protein ABIQ44_02525, partial [Chloroflexia bacterium]